MKQTCTENRKSHTTMSMKKSYVWSRREFSEYTSLRNPTLSVLTLSGSSVGSDNSHFAKKKKSQIFFYVNFNFWLKLFINRNCSTIWMSQKQYTTGQNIVISSIPIFFVCLKDSKQELVVCSQTHHRYFLKDLDMKTYHS